MAGRHWQEVFACTVVHVCGSVTNSSDDVLANILPVEIIKYRIEEPLTY